MSEPSATNHYATLGVERTADARAIKKAYFALVRKFPPETHPEDFKRIRAAYEVLSDADARERYDEQEKGYREYEDDVAATLAAVEEAVTAGDEAAAQAKLRAAIEAHPDVLILRERLAASLSRAKDHEAALAVLDELIERAPDTPRYHVHRGVVLRALTRLDDSEEALRKALELAPDDASIQEALVDTLAQNKHVDEALEILDEAAEKCEPTSRAGIGIQLRRVHVLYQARRAEEAGGEVDKLIDLARESDDPELPRLIASELGGPAAQLFALHEFDMANAVLERCRALHPESLVLRPYPPKAVVDTAALPASALEWLARQESATNSPTIRSSSWGRPLWALVAAGVLLFVSHLLLYRATPISRDAVAEAAPFTGTVFGAVVMAALFACAALLGAHFLRGVRALRRSPIQGLTTIHPLYLLRADPERTEIYPLFSLERTHGVHHHQNGVYTHTALTLYFRNATVAVSFRNASFAQGWLDHLLAMRKRALELLAAGYLDAEHAVELVPPSVLDLVASRPASWWRPPVGWGRVVAGVAAALWVGAMLSGLRYGDELSFRAALRAGTPAAFDAYLRAHPEGRFAEDARKARERAIERATAADLSVGGAESAGRPSAPYQGSSPYGR